MCKILTQLYKNNINMSVHYYGIGDLVTSWEIKEIVDNAPFFDSFYVDHPLENIETMNDYIAYLFSLKFQALEEMVPHLLQEEHKGVILALCTKAKKACESINKGAVVKFINTYIEEIFALNDHAHDIRDETLNLIKQYSTGINPNVYAYLCSDHYYLVIANFDSFYKVINKDPTLFKKLYPTGHLSDLQKRRFKGSLDIFATILKSDNENLKMLVNDRISVLCADVEALVSSITSDNVMLCEGTIREFTSFLQHIKHPKATEFGIHYKTVEKVLFKKAEETGQHTQYEIPVEEILKQFSSIENWIQRLLSLTHCYSPDSNPPTFKSCLNFDRGKTHPLRDFCSTNIPTDSYFTRSHQMALNIRAGVGAATIVGIMSRPDVYEDYAKLIMSAILFISDQIQREDEHLFDDWFLLDRMLQTIIANRELDSESTQPLCYSTAMFTCSLMEKLLRLYYTDRVKGRLYVPIEHATLGRLLTENNAEIVDIFDPIHTRHLAFFMLKCGDKNIGHNYRNRLAHWTEMKNSLLTVPLVAKLLWLFTDVLNTIFVYYLGQAKHSEKDTNLE